MSNVFREASATGAASGRGKLARVAALVAVLAFALLTFADGSYATESELAPAAPPTDGKIVEVIIGNFTFAPKDLTIAPGTTVAGLITVFAVAFDLRHVATHSVPAPDLSRILFWYSPAHVVTAIARIVGMNPTLLAPH